MDEGQKGYSWQLIGSRVHLLSFFGIDFRGFRILSDSRDGSVHEQELPFLAHPDIENQSHGHHLRDQGTSTVADEGKGQTRDR